MKFKGVSPSGFLDLVSVKLRVMSERGPQHMWCNEVKHVSYKQMKCYKEIIQNKRGMITLSHSNPGNTLEIRESRRQTQ